MEYSFKGKKVLITGAGRGIGRDLVLTLAKQGAIIYALSKNPDNLKDLVQSHPQNIKPIQCDLRDWSATENALKDIEPLDHLVNNAGVAHREDFFQMNEQVFDEIFDVNVKAIVNVTKLITKKMVEAKKQGASVVNVSSVSAMKQSKGLLSYCASKAAVDMITKCAAIELADYGIRVNSVNPTIVMTQMGIDLWEDIKPQALARIPMGQFATEEQCTNAIMFLLSDLSAMTTGESFRVDGGVHAT